MSAIHYTKPSITELEIRLCHRRRRERLGRALLRIHRPLRAGVPRASRRQARHRHLELHRRAAHGPGGARHRPGRRSDPRRHQLDRLGRADHLSRRDAGSSSMCCPIRWCLDPAAGRSGDHAAHQGHHRRASLRQPLRHGCAAGDRRNATAFRSSRMRPKRSAPSGTASAPVQHGRLRHLLVPWHQDRDHRRRRHVRHQRRRALRDAC